MRNASYIERYLKRTGEIAATLAREEIDRVIEIFFGAWERGRTIFLIGNGGSAGTAEHFAADLTKCTIAPDRRRLRAVSLVDNTPLVSALTNDEGWDQVYVEQLKTFFTPGDVVVALSVHGGAGRDKAGLWSQNLLRALQYARDHGGTAVGLAGFDGGAMKTAADACIVVPADSTPLVESFHVVLHHLITFCLAERIAAEPVHRRERGDRGDEGTTG